MITFDMASESRVKFVCLFVFLGFFWRGGGGGDCTCHYIDMLG